MRSQPAVMANGVAKRFSLPRERRHTLKERVLHPRFRSNRDTLEALKPLSFAVDRGEFFGIVGRNGSGKSTLLKLLAGIYRSDEGSIRIQGRVSAFIELGVGFNPDLAARDNVILNGIMLGLSPAEARARYDQVIDFAELRQFEQLKLKNYSSGMHVRLAFSVMIQVDADVLLIDEVLAVGDAAFQQKCFEEFNRLRDSDKTILFVTHDMGAVNQFCDRAMLLERGERVMIDEPRRVADRYLDLNFNRAALDDVESEAYESDDENAETRRGDGAATIRELWFEDENGERAATLRQGEPCVIKLLVDFHEAVEHPSFAVALEDGMHRPIFATSTTRTEEYTGTFAAGEEATVAIEFENVLAPGRYFLTPQVARRGSGEAVLDRRESAASVVVTGSFHTGGLVDLAHDIRLERSADDTDRLLRDR